VHQIELCVICKQDSTENVQKLYETGVKTLNDAIKRRQDSIPIVKVGQIIHRSCRKNYMSERAVSSASQPSKSRHSTRSATPSFDLKKNCVFCACPVD